MVGIVLDRNEYGSGCVIFVVLGIIYLLLVVIVMPFYLVFKFLVATCFIFCIKIVVLDVVDVVGELSVIVLSLLGGSELD